MSSRPLPIRLPIRSLVLASTFAIAAGCASVLFFYANDLFPAAAEEPAWLAHAAEPTPTAMAAYLDNCLACLHREAALGALERFEQASGRLAVLALEGEQLAQVDIAIGGGSAATVAVGGDYALWDMASGRRTRLIERDHNVPEVRDLAMLPDGQSFAVASDEAVTVWAPGRDTPALTHPLVPPGVGATEMLRFLRASPTGPELAWVTENGGALFRPGDGRLTPLGEPQVALLGFVPPRHLVAVSPTEIRRWRTDIGELDTVAEIHSHGGAMGLSADGRHAYLWTRGTGLEVWDTTTATLLHTLALPLGEREPVQACSSGAEAPVVITTDEGELMLMAANAATPIARWRAHRGAVQMLRCAIDTPRVLTVGDSGREAKVWDLSLAIGAAQALPDVRHRLPDGWDASTDWRAPIVDHLIRWRVAERLPFLAVLFDQHAEDIPPFAGGGLLVVLFIWSNWPRRGGKPKR